MRIIHGLLPSFTLVVAACGPTNSAQDPGPTWFRSPPPAAVAEPVQPAPAPAIDPEPETPLERAAAKITDATKKPAKAKPGKPPKPPKKSQRASTDADSDDGDWDQRPAHETPPPPKKKLPETGRHIDEECDQDSQCISGDCTFNRCEHRTNTRMPKGEKCNYNNECESDNCYMDACQ